MRKNLKYQHRISLLCSIVVILAVAVVVVFMDTQCADSTMLIIGTVDGEPLYAGELGLFLNQRKDKFLIKLAGQYGRDPNENFWFEKFEGRTALERLKDEAMDDYIHTKITQILMKEYGIANDISYGSFLEAWKTENETRKEKEWQGKIVFGPVCFDEMTFYRYLHENREADLKAAVEKSYGLVDDELLYAYYEENKGVRYQDDYEEIKSMVRFDYLDHLFEKRIEDRVQSADVRLTEKYDSDLFIYHLIKK